MTVLSPTSLIDTNAPRHERSSRMTLWQQVCSTGRTLSLSLAAIAPLLMCGTTPATAESYRLGPQNKVRIKVFEWRATRDQVFEWTALNDQFTVGADGMLSL